MQNKIITKIGAIISNQTGQVLAVHKKGKPAHDLIMPGGKKEAGENDEQALRRELYEELGVSVDLYDYFGQFEDQAIYENAWLVMKVYRVTFLGLLQPSGEIDNMVWIGRDYAQTPYRFASILGKQILPRIFNPGEHQYG